MKRRRDDLEAMLARELTKFARQIVEAVTQPQEKPSRYIAEQLREAAEMGRRR